MSLGHTQNPRLATFIYLRCLTLDFPHVNSLKKGNSAQEAESEQLEGLAILHNAYQVDRRRPAKDDGTGGGKRLLLCQIGRASCRERV